LYFAPFYELDRVHRDITFGRTAFIFYSPQSRNAVRKSWLGRDIRIRLTDNSNQHLKNSGSINGMTRADPNFLLAVRDKAGRAVPRRMYEHPELASGHPFDRTVRPGETISEEPDVGRLFDMTHRAQYMIQVSRHKSEKPQDVLKSNRVTLVVSRQREV
jgi:hypothetical protein